MYTHTLYNNIIIVIYECLILIILYICEYIIMRIRRLGYIIVYRGRRSIYDRSHRRKTRALVKYASSFSRTCNNPPLVRGKVAHFYFPVKWPFRAVGVDVVL